MGIYIYLNNGTTNYCTITSFCFFSSYQHWNDLRTILLYGTIDYLKCISLDSNYTHLNIKSLLDDYKKLEENKEIHCFIDLLKRYRFLLDELCLLGIFHLLNVEDFQGKIPYENSIHMATMIEKVYDFIRNSNDAAKNDILKLNELFITSYSNQLDLLIE